MSFRKSDFGPDFQWGVSTAAYQIEGGHDSDGKGPSIWDRFTEKRRKIRDRQHGRIACDFYNRYPEDLRLIRDMHIPNYRFSISWSRIYPKGTGTVNPKGIAFYNAVIDECLSLGITPWITLYHWDLPLALEKKGGWTNRDIIQWFGEYVQTCLRHFGDRVKHWMVLNEPLVFTGGGYFLGVHAPGRRGLSAFLAAAHHAALCQAEGGRIVRSEKSDAKIGTTFSYSHIEPYRPTPKDYAAATRTDALLNRLYIEPLLGLGYPVDSLPMLKKIEKFMQAGDEKKLAFDMDFLGLQNYTREIVRHSPLIPLLHARIVKASTRNVSTTLMNWEVYPPALSEALLRWSGYQNIPEIIVTENGAAFPDELLNEAIQDEQRLTYLRDHIDQVFIAKTKGVNVTGYFVWTLMDNFEWAEGFAPRFGLIHVDFDNQQRRIKASGHWYSGFLQ